MSLERWWNWNGNVELVIALGSIEPHTLRERMKRKRDNKLIEDFVFYYSTWLKVTCLHGYL
jgi:hypothetical protein